MKSPFRSIRQTLFNEGKLVRYLGYAVGEVVLIIVGILMALKINDWNEDRKAQNIEQRLLLSLKAEITANMVQLDEFIDLHIASRKMCISILEHFADSSSVREIDHLDYLVENATAPWTINLQMGVIKSLISTGDIRYLQNETIVHFVTTFEDNVDDSVSDFARLIDVWNEQLWPRENLYIRRINRAQENNEYIGVDIPKSTAVSDYDRFFQDIVLENAFMLTLYEQTEIIKNEERLMEQMETIVEVINSEILEQN